VVAIVTGVVINRPSTEAKLDRNPLAIRATLSIDTLRSERSTELK
jgi:hypothetical protein